MRQDVQRGVCLKGFDALDRMIGAAYEGGQDQREHWISHHGNATPDAGTGLQVEITVRPTTATATEIGE
jgi:hypothetical protein